MILDISDEQFRDILKDEQFHLPILWDGLNFSHTLDWLFKRYLRKLYQINNSSKNNLNAIQVNLDKIRLVCDILVTTVNHYLNGFPQRAYLFFKWAMFVLEEEPLVIDAENVISQDNKETAKLFRVVGVDDNKPYPRSRVFHTPFNLRSKVSASRYSIAGHPSLYLSTSLNLCCEEIHYNPYKQFTLAGRFELHSVYKNDNKLIRVIDLGVKPQDFKDVERDNEIEQRHQHQKRHIRNKLLEDNVVRSSYLLWYPLIAASSFIRTNKNDPFAVEYILPQLLMQWVREKMALGNNEYSQLVGIRYFSCASKRASEMGFNYVFPTCEEYKGHPKHPYCYVLSKAFLSTKPAYIHEYESIMLCEQHLIETKVDMILKK